MHPLFRQVETLHDDHPWGDVLDAGTGPASLAWVSRLQSRSWTGVTASAPLAAELAGIGRRSPQDDVIVGDWSNPGLLVGREFDVVIADHLLPAIEQTVPYFQDRLFDRLRPHVRHTLYVLGTEPLPEVAETPGMQVVLDVRRFRDACTLLSGRRPERDMPMPWVVRRIDLAGFTLRDARQLPIAHTVRSLDRELQTGLKRLQHASGAVRTGMESAAADLRHRVEAVLDRGPLRFGTTYVVAGRR